MDTGNHMYDGNYQMKTTTTKRYDDDKYDEDKRDPPLQSNRLDPQRARCYRAEAGCSASPPDDDGFGGDDDGGGGGGGQTTSTNNRHIKSPQHISTTYNHHNKSPHGAGHDWLAHRPQLHCSFRLVPCQLTKAPEHKRHRYLLNIHHYQKLSVDHLIIIR